MKKISSLFLALFATIAISAQALLTIVKTSEGVYTMTYNDSANGWAFYDPMSQPIGVYLFLNPGDTTPSGSYSDLWTNIPTSLTWDGTNYSGTINLNTHNFNQTGGVLPTGTTINQLRFLFTESPAGNGSHQSSDKLGTDYGFTPSTLPTLATSNLDLSKKSVVINGKLHTSLKGNIELSVYEMSGKLVKNLNVKTDGNAIDLNVSKNGLYLVKITSGTYNEIVKFSK